MRITFNRFVFFTMALMLVIAACGPTPPEVSPPSDLPDLPTDLPSIPEVTVVVPNPGTGGSDEPFVFGMLLVGPYNDHGWSQAHYEAGKYVEEKLGATMVYQAMFDEMDEGTAIFKCTNDPPVGESRFLTYEGLPTDHYLWLTGMGGKLLRGELDVMDNVPARQSKSQ